MDSCLLTAHLAAITSSDRRRLLLVYAQSRWAQILLCICHLKLAHFCRNFWTAIATMCVLKKNRLFQSTDCRTVEVDVMSTTPCHIRSLRLHFSMSRNWQAPTRCAWGRRNRNRGKGARVACTGHEGGQVWQVYRLPDRWWQTFWFRVWYFISITTINLWRDVVTNEITHHVFTLTLK